MKKMLYLFSICLVLQCFMSSCDKDTTYPVGATISYSGIWTKDLMEFVVPVVTYTDFNGEHELRMPGNYCKLVESENPFYTWDNIIILKNIPVDNSIIVNFERINNAVIDSEKDYNFEEYLVVDSIIAFKDGSITRKYNNETIIQSNYYKGQKAEDYLNELCKTPRKVRIMINDKLQINKE